ESLGKPLPGRKNLILTRHPRRLIRSHPEVFGQYKEWRGGSSLKRPYQFNLKFEPNNTTEIRVFDSLHKLDPEEFPTNIFICGGAQIYEQALPLCSDLYLTVVKRNVEGDTFFPTFEDRFVAAEEVMDCADFKIVHYRHRATSDSQLPPT